MPSLLQVLARGGHPSDGRGTRAGCVLYMNLNETSLKRMNFLSTFQFCCQFSYFRLHHSNIFDAFYSQMVYIRHEICDTEDVGKIIEYITTQLIFEIGNDAVGFCQLP